MDRYFHHTGVVTAIINIQDKKSSIILCQVSYFVVDLQQIYSSARFSQKVVSGKKPPTSKNLAAHLEILPLTPKKLVAKIANKTEKFSG